MGGVGEVGQQGVGGIGQKLPEHDHQLVLADQPAAAFGPGHFGQEHRYRRRSTTHRHTEDKARDYHDGHIGGQGAAQGADHEENGQAFERGQAAEAIRQVAGEQRSQGGAKNQRRGHQAFSHGVQAQAALIGGQGHEGQRTGNHASVVAERQGAHGCNHCDPDDQAVGTLCGIVIKFDVLRERRCRGGSMHGKRGPLYSEDRHSRGAPRCNGSRADAYVQR